MDISGGVGGRVHGDRASPRRRAALMRIVLIAPGHIFSTLDVFTGIAAGLRANGVTVYEYPLHRTFEAMELMVGAAEQMGIAPEGGYPDPTELATMGIPGYVMA